MHKVEQQCLVARILETLKSPYVSEPSAIDLNIDIAAVTIISGTGL